MVRKGVPGLEVFDNLGNSAHFLQYPRAHIDKDIYWRSWRSASQIAQMAEREIPQI